jgi:hypothetical protein
MLFYPAGLPQARPLICQRVLLVIIAKIAVPKEQALGLSKALFWPPFLILLALKKTRGQGSRRPKTNLQRKLLRLQNTPLGPQEAAWPLLLPLSHFKHRFPTHH